MPRVSISSSTSGQNLSHQDQRLSMVGINSSQKRCKSPDDSKNIPRTSIVEMLEPELGVPLASNGRT